MPAITWVSAGVAAILLIVGAIMAFSPTARAATRKIPLVGSFDQQMLAYVLLIVAFLAGGFGYIGSNYLNVASIGSDDAQQVNAPGSPDALIDYCTYSAGDSQANNLQSGSVTIRSDTNSLNTVFVDIDESVWNATAQAGNEANLSFNCVREGQTAEDGKAKIVAKASPFFAETTSSDSTEYVIVSRSTAPSLVGNKGTLDVRLANNGYATSTSTREVGYLQFTEGISERTLGVRIEVDQPGYGRLNNFTRKDVTLYQQFTDGTEEKVATVAIQKVP